MVSQQWAVLYCLVRKTYDLQYASPATISRCGMVWVDPKYLGYTPFWEKWVQEQRDAEKSDEMGDATNADDEDDMDDVVEGDRFDILIELYEKYIPESKTNTF